MTNDEPKRKGSPVAVCAFSVNAHGSYGSYWSSSCGDSGYAYYISSCNSDIVLDNGYYRYGGLSVRPVL